MRRVLLSRTQNLSFNGRVAGVSGGGYLLTIIGTFSRLSLSPRAVSGIGVNCAFRSLVHHFSRGTRTNSRCANQSVVGVVIGVLLSRNYSSVFSSNGVGTAGFMRRGAGRCGISSLATRPIIGLPATSAISLTPTGRRHLSRVVTRVGSHANGGCSGGITIGTVLRVGSVVVGSSGLGADTGGGDRGSFRFTCFGGVSSTLVRNLSRGRSFFALLLSGRRLGGRILNVFTSRVCRRLQRR